MRGKIGTLAFLLLMMSACKKPEDVLPVPQRYQKDKPPETPEQVDETVQPQPHVDLEVYQYGAFDGMPYRILLPRNYDSTKIYPLHLFLHGIGERGNDNEKQLSVGSSYFQTDSVRTAYPAFIVFPQCDQEDYWFDADVIKKLKDLVDTLCIAYRIDSERVSIGGFSMGAYGTFAMVAAYPKLFATALVISGDGDAAKATIMTKPGWQIFAGKRDHVVPSSRTEKMAAALRKAGASVSYKLYPEADHRTTWVRAFSEPNIFRRIFSH